MPRSNDVSTKQPLNESTNKTEFSWRRKALNISSDETEETQEKQETPVAAVDN